MSFPKWSDSQRETPKSFLHHQGSIGLAALAGIPAYLNGYAALPLVNGLIQQGMSPGAGMAFLPAGGATSIPAMIAVFALARRPVFLAYLDFAFLGSVVAGVAYTAVPLLPLLPASLP